MGKSGISSQVDFYRHIGFEIQGPPVTENGIVLYPMLGNLNEIVSGRRRPVYLRFL